MRLDMMTSLLAFTALTLGVVPNATAVTNTQDSLRITAVGGGSQHCTWDPACSTAGMNATLREKSRISMGRQRMIEYELVATGLPAGKLFTLWLFPFGEQPIPFFTGLTGDSTGAMACADSSARATMGRAPTDRWCALPFPLMMPLQSFAPSEPVKAALISNDDSVRAFATVFPVPLEAMSGDCRLWLELAATSLDQFRLSGTGFQGGAEARFTSTSGNEVIESTNVIPATGSFWLLVSPAVKGKRGGRSRFVVATPGCTVTLQYRWGRDLR